MPPELSDNQLRLMVAIRDSESLQSTAMLGTVRTRDRSAIGADAARKVLLRAEARGLVTGEGVGQERTWNLTPEGRAAVDELRPARAGGDDATGVRGYVVLEELQLAELVLRLVAGQQSVPAEVLEALAEHKVYVPAASVTARNTEHAFRQVAKTVYRHRDGGWREDPEDEDGEVLTVPSIAIDEKRFKVQPVNARRGLTVSVG